MNTARELADRGARVGLLDADLYGPNVPRMLGDGDEPQLDTESETLYPPEWDGIKVMSIGFLVPDREAAVLRGPMLDSTLQRLLTDVEWGNRMCPSQHPVDGHVSERCSSDVGQ